MLTASQVAEHFGIDASAARAIMGVEEEEEEQQQ